MNPFDTVIALFALFAFITGFNAGLLRSLATILGYAAAAPIALVASPRLTEFLAARGLLTSDHAWWVPFAVLLAAGFVIGALLRQAIGGLTGDHTVFIDRVLGAVLGLVRVGLVAVLLVLIFARIIPPSREPAWLAESKLRPTLAAAGELGLRSLPRETEAYIDRLKKERGF